MRHARIDGESAGEPVEPVLLFEFASAGGGIRPLLFTDPEEVVAARTTAEVILCLDRVQDAVSRGYYAAGFLTYESAPAFDPAFRVREGAAMPLLWFGIYKEPLRIEPGVLDRVIADRAIGDRVFADRGIADRGFADRAIAERVIAERVIVERFIADRAIDDRLFTDRGFGAWRTAEWVPSEGVDEYREKILAIRRAIARGETYQINYTIRLRSIFAGDDLAWFLQLKKAQSSSYCAYLDIGDYRILSASPELFFHLKDQKITVRPMKGTVKRGATPEEDRAHAEWLYHSEKNRAENLMIVDLLRNDLNRIARTGTVRAEKLFEIERYPTVHQMTSTVTAELPEGAGIKDILGALFPTGSITGAPKVSSMKIIADLETLPREVYCGTIGYITPDREAVFNVPIRTAVIDARTGAATYGVGGGITWDSTPEDEYEEALVKARLLTWRGE